MNEHWPGAGGGADGGLERSMQEGTVMVPMPDLMSRAHLMEEVGRLRAEKQGRRLEHRPDPTWPSALDYGVAAEAYMDAADAEIARLRPIEALAQQLLNELHRTLPLLPWRQAQFRVESGIAAAKALGMEPSK